jgi:hypothetical protein
VRLLLFGPACFFTIEAAQEANVLALPAVENLDGACGAAAMIASMMLKRLAPPGLTLTQQITHGTLL